MIQFPLNSGVWQPLSQLPGLFAQTRAARTLDVIGRLAPGVTRDQARARLAGVAARLAREHPATNARIEPAIMPYIDRHFAPQMKTLFLMLMGAVACVLLIACGNVANLLLARAATRAREIAVRASLGASRARVVRQLLVESGALAAVAGMLGLGISVAGLRLFSAAVEQTGAPYWFQFEMDAPVFVFLAGICLSTAVLAGLAPALDLARTDISEMLKQGGRGGGGGRRARRWTGALIVAQMAMTLVLLAGAGSMIRGFLDLYGLDIGIETSGLTTMRLQLPEQQYATAAQRLLFYERLDERVRAVPVVGAMTLASAALGGGPLRQFSAEGVAGAEGRQPLRVSTVAIGAHYFDTLGIQLRRGRPLTARDGDPGQEHVVVNERFVQTYLSAVEPVGSRIQLAVAGAAQPPAAWLMIVGVSPTVGPIQEPTVYVPLRWDPPPSVTVIVRSGADVGTLATVLREEVRAIDTDLPLFNIETLDQSLAFARWPQRVFGSMFTIFAAIGLLLSGVGLYAVVAYLVAQRTHEIGVRMTLGARVAQVTWLVVRRTVLQLALGLALGLPLAAAVGLALPFGSRDLTTLVPVTVLLVAAGVAACAIPARRVGRLDPVSALRHE